MYLPILHVPRVGLYCKLQEKLHCVTGGLNASPYCCNLSHHLKELAIMAAIQCLGIKLKACAHDNSAYLVVIQPQSLQQQSMRYIYTNR